MIAQKPSLPSVSFFCNLVQGGAEKQAVESAKIMHEKGHPVVFYCYNLKKAFYLPEKTMTVYDLKNYQANGPEVLDKIMSIARLGRLVRERQPDFLISYTTLLNALNGLIGLSLGQKSRTRHIGSERNSVLRYTKGWLWRWICRFLYRGLDGVFANNSAAVSQLRSIIHFRQDRSYMLPNILDTDHFSRNADVEPYDPQRFSILIPARVCDQKNQKILVPVAKRLKDAGLHAVFVLAGNPEQPYAKEMLAMIDQENLSDSFDWLGQQEDVKQLYLSCDLTYLPSRFEGFSNSISEAMACESLVMGSDISSFTDLIQDGLNGIIVPLDDVDLIAARIIEIASWPEHRRSAIQKAARASILDYGREGYYHRFATMLRQVQS
jgi:glycosyltransferase involved in cell wall biosynthesis